MSSALKRMLKTDVARSAPRGPRADADSFRARVCYTAETSNVLKQHEPTLRTIFAGLAAISYDWRGEHVNLKAWIAFLQFTGLVGPDLALREAILCFAWSRMCVVDGRSRAGETKESVLPFEGFMEALCRMSLLKALPTDEEVTASGAAHAGVHLSVMRDRDPAAFRAFAAKRACAWGEQSDLVQPVHHCLAHTIAALVYQIKLSVEGGANTDLSLKERTMRKVVEALKQRGAGGRR